MATRWWLSPIMCTGILIVLLIVAFGLFYVKEHFSEMEYVRSSIDGRRYLVKNLPDSQAAADLLAQLNERLAKVVSYIVEVDGDNKDVQRLHRNYNPNNISEGDDDTSYTSYSINKGEQIVFCIRSRDGKAKLENINTLMYVGTHELSHLMTKDVGHTAPFWANFKILMEHAVKLRLYKKVDYEEKPKDYCGIKITSNVLNS
jgi:hypothetical protein